MIVSIHFGALAPRLRDQLIEQGLVDSKIELHERIIENLTFLRFQGYMNDSQLDRNCERLLKEIKKHIKPIPF